MKYEKKSFITITLDGTEQVNGKMVKIEGSVHKTFYEPLANFLQNSSPTSHKLLISFEKTSFELLMNTLQTSY